MAVLIATMVVVVVVLGGWGVAGTRNLKMLPGPEGENGGWMKS